MTNKQLTNVLRCIKLPSFYNRRGRLAYYYVKEKGYISLAGLFLDRALDKDSFFVHEFIQPLFFPFETYIFNFGDRIGNYWSENDNENIGEILSRNRQIKTLKEVGKVIIKKPGGDNEYYHQSLAFIYYILGDKTKSINEINKIIIEKNENVPEWRKAEIRKAKDILSFIQKDELHHMMQEWQKFTIDALSLPAK